MFGLVALEHTLHLQTTLEKIVFLVENVFTHVHQPTMVVSFSALFSLVLLRNVKTALKRYVWIYRIPEVLLVVIVSTGVPSFCGMQIHHD